MIFERLPVERQALVFFFLPARGRGHPPFTLLVEAAFGLVAQPLALEHLAEECGNLQFAALVVRRSAVMFETTWPRMSRPTRSMVRKVAERGQPTAWPVSASISSMVRSISCMRRITLSTENVPMRLPMKLGVSLASTTPLPSCASQKWVTASISAGSASGVGISSSRRM